MMYDSNSSSLVTNFSSTSTMTLSGSHLSSTIYPVGAPVPVYTGTIQPIRKLPGTGGFNPSGYDEYAGTGFPEPVGNGAVVLIALVFVFLCLKIRSKPSPKL